VKKAKVSENSSVPRYRQSSISKLDEEDTSGEATVEDYRSIQHRRHILIKWLHEPFFKDAVEGAYVRVFVGVDRKRDNQPAYRMAEVVSVDDDGAMYRITTTSARAGLGGEPVTHTDHTSIRLTLAIGSNLKKNVKLTEISDKRIEEKEYHIYRSILADAGLQSYKILTKKQVENRRETIVQATKHVYTDKEIKDMVRLKQGMNKALVTNYQNAMTSLRNNRQRFLDDNNMEKVHEVDKTIEKLEKEIALQKVLFDRAAVKFSSLNRRNREGNFKKDVEAGVKKRQEESKGNVVTAAKNPYLRRETRPTNLWNTGAKLSAARAEVDNKGGASSAASTTAAAARKPASESTSAAAAQVASASSSAAAGAMSKSSAFDMISIDEIRQRFLQKHGFDPIAAAMISPQDRYLMRQGVMNLPPKGSAEREALRKGLSVQAYFQRSSQAASASANSVVA
jgi:hypothetical protein